MEFDLSEDQELFRETTAKFLAAELPISAVRELETDAVGFDPKWWRQGAELGWTSMLVSEGDGGGSLSGAGLRDLAIIAEYLGRHVAPGPLVPVNVVARAVSLRGTSEQKEALLPGLLDGSEVAAWCVAEPGSWDGRSGATTAVLVGDEIILEGTKVLVEAGAQASTLLVTARTGEGWSQLLVPASAPGVTIVPMKGLDLVRRFAEVRFDTVRLPRAALLGELGTSRADVEEQLHIAIALQCAETVGVIDRVLEFTLEYMNDRYSFGRPISSYQALKHRVADLKLWLEACHGTATAAVRATQEDAGTAAETVSAAASYIGDHAPRLIQECVQLHGGIGVTKEHDLHLYLRRAVVDRSVFGTPAEHRTRIAALLGM